MYSSFCCDLLLITCGHPSSLKDKIENLDKGFKKDKQKKTYLIGYSEIGKSPFHWQTSHLLAQIPRLPAAKIKSFKTKLYKKK